MAGNDDMVKKTTSGEHKSGQEQINERLRDALDGLRKDVTRVEIWATALGSFTQAVPGYGPDKTFELGQADTKAPKEAKDDASAPDQTSRKKG